MRRKTLAIAVLLFCIPLGIVFGVNQRSDNRLFSNRSKEANTYLDQAEAIIANGSYLSIYGNTNGERNKFLQLVNNSLKIKESARGYFYLGIAGHMTLKSAGYEEAVQNYKKAIELNPEYLEAFIALGSVNLNRKNYQECVNSFEQALKLEPKHKQATKLIIRCRDFMFSVPSLKTWATRKNFQHKTTQLSFSEVRLAKNYSGQMTDSKHIPEEFDGLNLDKSLEKIINETFLTILRTIKL